MPPPQSGSFVVGAAVAVVVDAVSAVLGHGLHAGAGAPLAAGAGAGAHRAGAHVGAAGAVLAVVAHGVAVDLVAGAVADHDQVAVEVGAVDRGLGGGEAIEHVGGGVPVGVVGADGDQRRVRIHQREEVRGAGPRRAVVVHLVDVDVAGVEAALALRGAVAAGDHGGLAVGEAEDQRVVVLLAVLGVGMEDLDGHGRAQVHRVAHHQRAPAADRRGVVLVVLVGGVGAAVVEAGDHLGVEREHAVDAAHVVGVHVGDRQVVERRDADAGQVGGDVGGVAVAAGVDQHGEAVGGDDEQCVALAHIDDVELQVAGAGEGRTGALGRAGPGTGGVVGAVALLEAVGGVVSAPPPRHGGQTEERGQEGQPGSTQSHAPHDTTGEHRSEVCQEALRPPARARPPRYGARPLEGGEVKHVLLGALVLVGCGVDGEEDPTATPNGEPLEDAGDALAEGLAPLTELTSGECPKLSKSGRQSFVSNGVDREVLVYMPRKAPADMPVVFFWHGLGDTAENLARALDLEDFAKKNDLVVVVPESLDPLLLTWNVLSGGDDAALFDDMRTCLSQELDVDLERVHTAGFSYGAMFSTWLLLERGDTLASAVVLSGGVSEGLGIGYRSPAAPVPTLVTWGWRRRLLRRPAS